MPSSCKSVHPDCAGSLLTALAVTIASRVCLIVGDLIVLIVTWHSTFSITRAAQVANIRMSLTGAILKDGMSTRFPSDLRYADTVV